MKIGILGGTFDPPHDGHLAIARAAIEQLELDEVIFLPANQNPLKNRGHQTPAKARMEMVRRLVENEPNVAMSDIEITRGGKSYAVDTLSELQMAQPAEYWFLMGADTVKELTLWKAPQRLVKLCRLGVVSRPPHTDADVIKRLPPELAAAIDIIKMPTMPVSSTEIRDRLAQKRDVSALLPGRVLTYIRENKLYQI
ncbi:MAG TPA: nicotinate-nucleotide adenylyltransferase [Fimbriimonas sp.]|nr:nicotinate-nucleotide adenylyltransferase [Fimbriimonas sp.]